ncbi:MAG: zinc ABC transporter substrate-binding protein [Proteobacteria bacterium]|nr:zinc ABC transporter substrate-binding protein [Pseudomonadota bacterium]
MSKQSLLIALLFFCFSFTCQSNTVPQVAVTIKPIHGLVASLMQGVGTPVLLLPDNASPHTFQLKPSTLKQLQAADLVIWVGPELELFMQKPLTQLSPRFGMIKLLEIPKLQLLEQRAGRQWSQHDHGHEHTHDDVANFDPHFWLSTDNAIVVVDAICQHLSTIDKANAPTYQANANHLKNQLSGLKLKLTQILKNSHQKPFLVYHDGYQYFEKEFNLNAKGTLMLNPHLPLSARGFKDIKTLIATHHVKCVFRETEFNDVKMTQLLNNIGVNLIELDPLGARVPAGPGAYEAILLAIANTFAQCLA